jgi:hypothetical protein
MSLLEECWACLPTRSPQSTRKWIVVPLQYGTQHSNTITSSSKWTNESINLANSSLHSLLHAVVHTGELGESELLTLLGLERPKVLGQACLPQESVAALTISPQLPDLPNFCVEDVCSSSRQLHVETSLPAVFHTGSSKRCGTTKTTTW